jgi:hypothetical protein
MPVLGPRLLTREQAAAYLAVSPWTVTAYEAEGLPRVQLRRAVRYDRADLDALVERLKERP